MSAMLLMLAGCASLLPDSNKVSQQPFASYAEAAAAFERIVPGQTTLAELKERGIDPAQTPNVEILSHVDLLRRVQAMVSFEASALDPAIKKCIAARDACFAYRVEQQTLQRERVGNFWVDFLNFRHVTHISGWQFDALIVISRDVVVYKSWSGKPNIRETEQEHHPLGPLQGLGSSLR